MNAPKGRDPVADAVAVMGALPLPVGPDKPATASNFFKPGRTYQRRRWHFQCLAVAPNPFNGETRAVGFLYRPGEMATATALDPDDWAHGEWSGAPADPCYPCGCPKRFNRHAWGCPTLRPADSVEALHASSGAVIETPGRPVSEDQARVIERDNPAAAFTHDCGIPLTRRLDCGHCPHEICADCGRCPHTCRCAAPLVNAQPHESTPRPRPVPHDLPEQQVKL
jgi:hypothetical protein